MGVSGSQDHVIKARNWLWNSVLPLLCSQVSCSWPDTIAFLCNIYAKILWTRWKWLLQETRAKVQSCDGKCQKIPSTGAWGRYTIRIVFTKMYRLYSQQFMGSITLNDWQTGWLMKAWIRSQTDTSQCTARSTLRAGIPEIHHTNGDFISIWQFLFFFGCMKGTRIMDLQMIKWKWKFMLQLTPFALLVGSPSGSMFGSLASTCMEISLGHQSSIFRSKDFLVKNSL